MNEGKFKRIVVAGTVAAVLLIVILLATMIYQISAIGNERRKYNDLQAEIARYEQLISETGDSIETRSMRWWIERRARELGYYYDGDNIYDGKAVDKTGDK